MSVKHIVITGASSGIGKALALHYAQPNKRLALSGRNKERLKDVAKQCEDQGCIVELGLIDVMDRPAMTQWLLHLDDLQEIDLIIANAGISGGSSPTSDWEETTRDIFAINLAGTLNTILPLIPRMRARKHGQVALMSSLAGFRALPSAPAYSASKVCVKAYGEALRMRYKNDGLKINVICPGFVNSRITQQNTFKMPLIMKADKAASLIAKGLEKNKAIIAFPWRMAFITRLFSNLPLWLIEWISTRMPHKE